jgi:hypothetical protein
VPAQARDGAARAGHRERDAMGRGVALEPPGNSLKADVPDGPRP